MKRIIKTVPCYEGILYAVLDSNRVKLTGCRADIEITEELADLPVLGKGHIIKRRYANLLLTFDHKPTAGIADDTLSGFSFEGDFICKDGKLERLMFPDCRLNGDLDLTATGKCEFEIECSNRMLSRLKEM
jgi:hypothetical protein